MARPSVRLDSIEIPVADLKRATAWYRSALGLECIWSDQLHALLEAAAGVRILLVATRDETRLGFHSSHSGVDHSVVDFHTDDLESLHAHLCSQHARVDELGPPAHDWAPRGFGFFDSEGNRLGAYSYRR